MCETKDEELCYEQINAEEITEENGFVMATVRGSTITVSMDHDEELC